jgi:hypothetical protein
MTEPSTRADAQTRNRDLTTRDHLLHGERERLEQSKLLELVGSICSDINVRAGELVVESQSYLPPQAILRSFVFVNGNAEYVMQIELLKSEPVATFLTRRWRDLSRNLCVRLLYRLGVLEPFSIRFKFACPVDEDRLTREEKEKWFGYLLSGLKHKSKPDRRSGPGLTLQPSNGDSQEANLAGVKTITTQF